MRKVCLFFFLSSVQYTKTSVCFLTCIHWLEFVQSRLVFKSRLWASFTIRICTPVEIIDYCCFSTDKFMFHHWRVFNCNKQHISRMDTISSHMASILPTNSYWTKGPDILTVTKLKKLFTNSHLAKHLCIPVVHHTKEKQVYFNFTKLPTSH